MAALRESAAASHDRLDVANREVKDRVDQLATLHNAMGNAICDVQTEVAQLKAEWAAERRALQLSMEAQAKVLAQLRRGGPARRPGYR